MPRTPKGPISESAMVFSRDCRKAMGLNQTGIAGRTGVSQQQVSKYETGKSRVPLEFVRALEALSGWSLESFERSTDASGSARQGFDTRLQQAYTAEGSREISRGSDDQQSEPMTLDLRSIDDPADRQSVRDLHAALSHKRGGI